MALVNAHHFKDCRQVYREAGLPSDTGPFVGPFSTLSLDRGDPLLDKTSGVYLIWRYRHDQARECIYVGEVSRQPAHRRLRQHWDKADNPHLRDWILNHALHFCFAPCSKGKEKFYEKKLMDLLDPKANIRR